MYVYVEQVLALAVQWRIPLYHSIKLADVVWRQVTGKGIKYPFILLWIDYGLIKLGTIQID